MYIDKVWRKGPKFHSMLRNEGHARLMGGHTEVEMFDYQRLPGGESPSPVDYIKGESSKYQAVTDLDRFFERLYNYYCNKGFWCIVTQWIVELLCLGFTIGFSGFFLLFVDWHGLRMAKCGIAAAEAGSKPCDLSKEALYEHPLKPLTFYRFMVVTYLVLLSVYWLWCFLRFFTQLRETLEIRDFYHRSLGITEREIRTTPWPILLEKTVQQRLCIVRHLSAHDIVMRIMRKENYMIAMVNKGIFALSIPRWVPSVGPSVYRGPDGQKKYLFLSKPLEWILNWCILQYMFDRNFLLRRDFTNDPMRLRKRLRAVGFGMLLLSPFLIIFRLVGFFLKHAEQFYNHPSSAISRRWSNLARWTFREFNELEHMFNQRLNASYRPAVEYVKQFSSPIVSMIAKFVSFVAGGLAAVLIIIAFLDESLLEAHLFGRNLFWLAAVFGTITAISRSAIAEEFQVYDPEGAMKSVAQHTHYMPKHWRGAEGSHQVRSEFEILFQYIGVILLEEMVSVFVTPFILFVHLPECVDDVLKFVQEFTVNITGVGHVCSLSVFDFEHHGNSKYGSPFHTIKERRSAQGKMEKSFLSFKSNYPNWEPDLKGKQFLSSLAEFRSRHEDTNSSITASPFQHLAASSMYRSRLMGNGCWQPFLCREGQNRFPMPKASPRSNVIVDNQLCDSIVDQMDHIYWLDQFYTSRSVQFTAETEEPSTRSKNDLARSLTGMPSTSQTVSPENELVGRVANIPGGESRWWARKAPGSTVDTESFFEPPTFGDGHLPDYQIGDMESDDDHEMDWTLRRQSRSAFTSSDIDHEPSEFDLPFGDVYERPREIKKLDS